MRSLKFRLVLIPTGILLVGFGLVCGFAVVRASGRIRSETNSAFALGQGLVNTILIPAEQLDTPRAVLESAESHLPRLRHVDLMVVPSPKMIAGGELVGFMGDRPDVPDWFANLLKPARTARTVPIVLKGQNIGSVMMISNPYDELGEIWNELVFLAAFLLALLVAMVLLISVTTSLSLRPLRAIADGFDALGRGAFDTVLAPIRVTELARIGAAFNQLARKLGDVTADNHLLIDRLLSVQEAERREVAHELHDEFGPSLFAIRAELASISRWCRNNEPRLADIGERAQAIGQLVDGIQRTNARMLEQLRPMVLEEMGLSEALRQLLDSWRRRVPTIAWSLDMRGDLDAADDELALTLYRMVQECMTNVSRHAEARRVGVFLGPVADGAWLHVAVRDDGKGFEKERFGYGLLGMAERVRGAGGKLSVGNQPTGGAVIEAWLPWTGAQRTQEQVNG